MIFVRPSKLWEKDKETSELFPPDSGRAACSLCGPEQPSHSPQRPHEHDRAGTMATGPEEDGEGRRTDKKGAHKDHGGDNDQKRVGQTVGQEWKTFFVPLFSDVEITQCEEEDRSRQDTETKRQTDVLSSTRSSSSNVFKSPSCSP